MNEGKLYNEIDRRRIKLGLDGSVVPMDVVEDVLDEANRDFPDVSAMPSFTTDEKLGKIQKFVDKLSVWRKFWFGEPK